jgi:hypothetical protein
MAGEAMKTRAIHCRACGFVFFAEASIVEVYSTRGPVSQHLNRRSAPACPVCARRDPLLLATAEKDCGRVIHEQS